MQWSGRAAPVTIQEKPWEVLTNSNGSQGLLLPITHFENHRGSCAAAGPVMMQRDICALLPHVGGSLWLPGPPLQISLLLRSQDQNLDAIESKACAVHAKIISGALFMPMII
jgi:hypothetical protein